MACLNLLRELSDLVQDRLVVQVLRCRHHRECFVKRLLRTSFGERGPAVSIRTEQEKLAALQAAERRHPQADDLLAATMANPSLLDGLHHRIRTDVVVEDEYGRRCPGGTACRIFEYENVATLHVLVSLIVQNGGLPIVVGEHGVLPDGLPQLPRGALTQLRRNGYLTVQQEGAGLLVGLGLRVRKIGAHWGVQVPASP